MLLAVGVLAALWERERSGLGQVIDASMVEGSALLGAMFHGCEQPGCGPIVGRTTCSTAGRRSTTPTRPPTAASSPCGAIEPKFYAALIVGLGLSAADLPSQYDAAGWPRLRSAFAEVFASRTRDQWSDAFAGSDACVAPVLDMGEAAGHPHNKPAGHLRRHRWGGAAAPAPRLPALLRRRRLRRFIREPTPTPFSRRPVMMTAAIVRLRSDGVVG